MDMWIRKIIKTGNSLSLSIPRPALQCVGVERGDYVVIWVGDSGCLLVQRFDPQKRPDLLALADEDRVIKV